MLHCKWLRDVAVVLLLLAALESSSEDNTKDFVDEFVGKQRKLAAEAYEQLYGDGFGIDGEPAPPIDSFTDNYVTEALTRETKRILETKGYPGDYFAPSKQPAKKSITDVEKKDSPQTLDGQIELLAVQKRQKQVVRERVREGKPLEVLAPAANATTNQSWEVACGETLFSRHLYDAIPGCSPGRAGKGSLSTRLPCKRIVFDEFITELEEAHMVVTMDKSFRGLFHQGAETLLVPEHSSRNRMGEAGFRLTAELLERIRVAVMESLNISRLFYSGSLLKRMDYPPIEGDMQIDLSHDSSNPHVDKANIASYDYSALLYFTSVGEDFDGGELLFADADADRMIPPLAGRLVAFSSGLENLHRVMPMTRGQRYVLSMWFTCSEKHAHPSLGGAKEFSHLSDGRTNGRLDL